MRIEKLACPACNAPISGDFAPNQQFECQKCGSTLFLADFTASQAVVCPQCRTPNNDTVRFCTNCGQSLRVDCPLCYTSNRVDISHCANCGAHLERARRKREALQAAKRRFQLEREDAFREKEKLQFQQKLARLLDDLDEPENHDFAIYQLNQMGGAALEALLTTLLHDADVDARYGSARAIGQISTSQNVEGLNKARAVKALVRALADPEPPVRYWSAEALGRIQSPIAVEPLAKLLKDAHEGVREQARRSLEQIGGERAQELLKKRPRFLKWFGGD